MKLIVFILLIFFQSLSAASYDTTLVKSKTNIAGSLGGHSLISFHIEYLSPINYYTFLTMSSGMGLQSKMIWGYAKNAREYVTFPNQLSLNLGDYKHSAEVGLGLLTVIGKTNKPFVPYAELGYRVQKKIEPGKIVFRFYIAYQFGGYDWREITFFPFGFSFGTFL